MDAIIGKYRVRMEDSRLIITHSAGISFDLTMDEAQGLWYFLNVYSQAFEEERDTDARIPRISLERDVESLEHL